MNKICSFLVLLVLFCFSGGGSFASDDPVKRFDELVLRYERRIQGRESSALLRTALESEAETANHMFCGGPSSDRKFPREKEPRMRFRFCHPS